MNRSCAVVITSIFEPTEAVCAFAKMSNQRLFVVGDKKTPMEWKCPNATYLSVEEQQEMRFELVKTLPFNHYCRKMLGYISAIKDGCEYIIDTDDDNMPKKDWAFPALDADFDCFSKNKGFINVYQLFTRQKIWPRGLPLNYISSELEREKEFVRRKCRVGVWQGLVDEDPDVDAIYRLTSDMPCVFEARDPIVLGEGTISPFNTQNTMVRKELFPLLYLPVTVTFRYTDILRGLIAQPIMWAHNYQLGFTKATVVQKRNPHNYMKDFLSEIPMYENGGRVVDIVMNVASAKKSITDNLYNSYCALLAERVVQREEMTALECWIKDLDGLSKRCLQATS